MSSKTTYALGGVALALVVLIVILAFRWGRDDTSIRNDGYGSVRNSDVHAVLDQNNGTILVGHPDAPKTIDVYEDPLCPSCGALERIYGQEIAQKMDEGKLAVRYHLVTFLDTKSKSKDYSTRAVAANECVAATGSGPVYSKFHTLLFTSKQPKEGGADLSNEDLANVAKEAGASLEAVQCISGGAKLDGAKIHAQMARAALTDANGEVATPAVFDGKTKIDVNNQDWVVDLTK
ncbi:DsbA family protein [Nocardia sp. NBC_00565]|uniref:DsbA family protein n=1 Tax=Nocardia sp. NBC_00565 TaxID=2975993 RepID=UPI002E81B032|nr:thioredoxin domain-containing protein [Nocardia sp. NBC_00565]WUC00373.1 DsbA family protein [Nocardia sp. NBC_00565]